MRLKWQWIFKAYSKGLASSMHVMHDNHWYYSCNYLTFIIILPPLLPKVCVSCFLVYLLREAAFKSILIPTFHALLNFED